MIMGRGSHWEEMEEDQKETVRKEERVGKEEGEKESKSFSLTGNRGNTIKRETWRWKGDNRGKKCSLMEKERQ